MKFVEMFMKFFKVFNQNWSSMFKKFKYIQINEKNEKNLVSSSNETNVF
jgi:hypothetical protein